MNDDNQNVQDDSKVVSREQNNMNKNVPHVPQQGDDIDLKSPNVQGEESVSGDMPEPESDDDTLLNAHAVGEQLKEDLDDPKEIDLGRDVDEAEEKIRES